MTQGIQEQIGVLPAIKPEFHLFEIGREMLCADMVPTSHDSTLEKRESIFDGISMDVADHINFGAMVDGLVLVLVNASLNHCLGVANPIIGDDPTHVHTDAIFDVFGERVRFGVLDMVEPNLAAALPDADYDFFIRAAPGTSTVLDTADIGFIHFDRAVEHLLVHFDHCCANPMAEIPCSFVAHSNRSLNLAGRHSLLGFAEQQGSHEPLCQWQVRVIEDRASGHGKLVVTVFAVEKFLLGFKFRSGLLAARALDAKRPAETAQHFAASFVSREFGGYVC